MLACGVFATGVNLIHTRRKDEVISLRIYYKTLRLSACLFTLLCLSSVGYASQPSSDVHFCLPLDFEDMRERDSIYAATKQAFDLNVGEPRTVRMIYFLPNDRPFRQEVVQKMKDEIRNIQTFFAEQMQAHGYGNKTFRFETDVQDEPLIHRVDGQHPDSHYLEDTYGTVFNEIEQMFNLDANIYSIVIDNSTNSIGLDGWRVAGIGERRGKNGGYTLFPGGFSFKIAAHELGHAFGLAHDFNNDAYMMSYGPGQNRLSMCHAEYLTVDSYFNPDASIEEAQLPTIELISSPGYPAGSKSVSVQLQVRALEGLHQVLFFVTTSIPHPAAGLPEVKVCRRLAGQKDAVIEFEYDGVIPSVTGTSLSNPAIHPIYIEAVDTEGNVGRVYLELWEFSPQHIATLERHTDEVGSVAFLPDNTTIASGSPDDGVILWSIATKKDIATFEETARSMAFSPDGTILATALWDIHLWDVATRTHIANLESPLSLIRSMAFSPDGQHLAGASQRGVWIYYDVVTTRKPAILTGHTDEVFSVSFSPDGTTLASGSYDDRIKLWDVVKRRNIATLSGHTNDVYSVAFSLEGTTLASGSYDHTVRLWDVSEYVTPVVYMPDANLRAVIRDALGKSRFAPITVTDMASLTTLDASNHNIRDLTGLESATSLTELNLMDNPLNAPSLNTHIPALQSRGVEVLFDKPTPDFDGDGIVGVGDFLLFVEQFGFSEDDAGYDARFDLDGDGVIGIGDFLIFVDNFGKVVSSN